VSIRDFFQTHFEKKKNLTDPNLLNGIVYLYILFLIWQHAWIAAFPDFRNMTNKDTLIEV